MCLLSTLRLLSIVFKYAFRKVETVGFLEVVVSEKQETAWLYTISKTGRVTDSVLGPTAKSDIRGTPPSGRDRSTWGSQDRKWLYWKVSFKIRLGEFQINQ